MTDEDGREIDASELEEDFNEIEFQSGFNQGYAIAELDADLALELDKEVTQVSSHSNGFVAGIKEFFRSQEKRVERENELDTLRGSSSERERTL